jgi:hypothetical protein
MSSSTCASQKWWSATVNGSKQCKLYLSCDTPPPSQCALVIILIRVGGQPSCGKDQLEPSPWPLAVGFVVLRHPSERRLAQDWMQGRAQDLLRSQRQCVCALAPCHATTQMEPSNSNLSCMEHLEDSSSTIYFISLLALRS